MSGSFYTEILGILTESDNDFVPALSQKINVQEYAGKIVQHSIILPLYIKGELCCFISFYANDLEAQKAFITMVLVKKSHQGKGLGKQLVHAAMQYSKTAGMQTMRLEVAKSNMAAYHLYCKMGFVTVSESGESFFMETGL